MRDRYSIAAYFTLKHHLTTNKLSYAALFYIYIYIYILLFCTAAKNPWQPQAHAPIVSSYFKRRSFVITLRLNVLLLQGNYIANLPNPSRGERSSTPADQIKHLTEIADGETGRTRASRNPFFFSSFFLKLLNNS